MVTKTKDYLKVHSGKDEERYPEGVLPGGFDRLSPSKKIRHLRRSMRWWLEHARENMISEATLLKIVKHFWMAEIKENPTWHDAARVARSMEEFMDPLLTVLRSPEVFNDFEEHYTSSKQRKTQTVQVWIQKATELAAPLLGFVDEHDLVRKIVNNLHKDFQAAAPTLYEHLCDFARVDTQEAALTLQQKDAISLRALRETLDTRAHRAMIVTGEKAMGIDASKDDHEAEKKRSTRNRDRSPDGGKGGRSEKTDGKRGGARRRGKSDKGAAKEGNKGAKRERSDGDGRSDAAEKKAGTGNDRKKDVKCYNCQKKGHYAQEAAPRRGLAQGQGSAQGQGLAPEEGGLGGEGTACTHILEGGGQEEARRVSRTQRAHREGVREGHQRAGPRRLPEGLPLADAQRGRRRQLRSVPRGCPGGRRAGVSGRDGGAALR
jgi:hypothetical protein